MWFYYHVTKVVTLRCQAAYKTNQLFLFSESTNCLDIHQPVIFIAKSDTRFHDISQYKKCVIVHVDDTVLKSRQVSGRDLHQSCIILQQPESHHYLCRK